MLDASNYTWQHHGNNDWVFGLCVRGMVRMPKAEVYFDDDAKRGGWVWFITGPNMNEQRGIANSLEAAVDKCEELLGL
jgi:hypothetical protein